MTTGSWFLYVASMAMMFASVPAAAAAQEDPPAQEEVTGGPEDDSQFTEPGQSGSELPEMVVEAQNSVRQNIEKQGFEFQLTAAAVDSFLSPMDEEALNISPVSGLQPHLNNLDVLRSDQVPHPWLDEIVSTPMVTFYPDRPEGHAVKRWQITVTDFRGTPFKTFEGSGDPPDRVEWDGSSDSREMVEAGYPYSYVFTVTDKGTNTYNYAGVSFRLPAIDYRDDGNRVLELAGTELFDEFSFELEQRGQNWLTRAADEIRRHPFSPVRVVAVAETIELAEQRADAVATFLARAMIVPREQVETEARQRPDLRAELDGTIQVVIQHAD